MRLESDFLYAQHIDWAWLPQRPQLLADALVRLAPDSIGIQVAAISAHRHRALVDVPSQLRHLEPGRIKGAPFHSNRVCRVIDAGLQRQAARRLGSKAKLVWVTHPRLVPLVEALPRASVVYDCMDDAPAMSKNFRQVLRMEASLVERASLVFCSSPALAELLSDRHGVTATVIPNGVSLEHIRSLKPNAPGTQVTLEHDLPVGTKRAVFIGTVGSWVDQNLLGQVAAAPGWHLEIYGPLHVPLRPSLRPHYFGTLDQASLYARCVGAQVGLIPFLTNNFTSTIDPVKFYEYAALGLRVLSAPLPSLTAYSAYWSSWTADDDVSLALHRASELPLLVHDQALLKSMSWDARASDIWNRLRQLL